MRMTFADLPEHAGGVAYRLPNGTLSAAEEPPPELVGFRAACSCGWTGTRDYPPVEAGHMSANSEWVAHMKPLWASAPPTWLLNRSDSLRVAVADLVDTWPLQALGVLKDVDRWHRKLLEQSVEAARRSGSSWSEIGAALGISKQSAHERFKADASSD